MKRLTIIAAVAAAFAATGAYAQSGPIKIGVVTPLTGTYAGIGQQVKWGIEMAVKEINDKGGILGRKVETIYEDEEANPNVAVQKAEKLFQVSKVDFLTGTVNSGSTLAVGQVAERNARLAATTVSFSDAITGDKCSPNMFRVNAKAGMQSAALAEWMVKEKPNASVYYLGPDYEMGRSTVAAFKAAAEAKGAKSVGEVYAPLDNKDYSPFFGQIRAARPQVLYTSVAGNDTVRFLSQLSEFGLAKQMQIVGAAGSVTAQNMGAIGKAAEGYVTGAAYSGEIDTPANKKFVADFKAAWKADPDLYGVDSYGVMYFYKAAAEKAGTTDTDKLRTAMRGLEWQTPQGKKTMRAGDHQAIQDMYAVKVVNGKFQIISKVPGEAAVGADTCTKF
ncbi:MAG: ABC transporter substrate-binding protein [Proteobacteria bacterium]|nr:ABC transporter substrate-binding protein [Pseudomonadota bacterium]